MLIMVSVITREIQIKLQSISSKLRAGQYLFLFENWVSTKRSQTKILDRQKRLYFIKNYFLALYPTKFFHWKVFFLTFSNISEKNCLDNSVFNNVNRLDHSSLMNNTVANKTKHFPQLFSLSQQILLKLKWHHFLP